MATKTKAATTKKTAKAAAKPAPKKAKPAEAATPAIKADNGGAEPESAPIPLADLQDLVDADFAAYCIRYREILDEEAALKKEKEELSATIKPLMEEVGVKSVDGGDWVAVYAGGKSTSISKELLLAKGVTMATIKACTKEKPYTYIQVRKQGE